MRRLASRTLIALLLAGASVGCGAPSSPRPPIALEVDATDILRGIQHAHLVIPVQSGPLTLVYPKWIPGEHAATGPLTQIVGLMLSASGKAIAWNRDLRDPFSLHIEVPQAVDTIEAEFDFLSPPSAFGDGYGKTPNVTPHLLILPFNHVLLYPQGADVDALSIKAKVRIPSGWKFDSALRPESVQDGTIDLPLVSLRILVDSPLLAGEYFRTIHLTEGMGATRLSIAADAQADLAVEEAQIGQLKQLVAEANALFGGRHYREYVFLVALGDRLNQNGLEHHESTDIRGAESFFTDPAQQMRWGNLFPHEYVHSWNGKYRRPAGLASRNYQEPVVDELLWVYEGMTRYLGDVVLRARSGLRTTEQMREYVAWIAALMDRDRPGRNWRSVGDTATALPGYNDSPTEWTPVRRARDYYDEMLLVWLEADTILRQKSSGTRSLDDFCRAFFGGQSGAPAVRSYTRPDLVKALGDVAAYDWNGFLALRVDTVTPHTPLDGLLNAGWKLVYDDTPNEYLAAREKATATTDLSFSLGLWVKPDGTVADVVHGSSAFDASLAPTMRLIAIDGAKWSVDAARSAIKRVEKIEEPIELVVQAADLVRTVRIDYHDGLLYPHLMRDISKPDLLSAILAARTGQTSP